MKTIIAALICVCFGIMFVTAARWHNRQIENAIYAGWYIGATDIANYAISLKKGFYHKVLISDEIVLLAKKIMEVGYEKSGVSLYN